MAGQSVVVSVLADTKQFGAAMGNTGKQAGGLGKTLLKLGGIAAAAFSVKAIVDFGRAAVDAASSLEQSVGGVASVFKAEADAVKGYSDAAASNLGLSKNAYNELATAIGTTLKNSGTPLKDLAGDTNDLVTRAADLAATFGGPVTDATAAMGSALRGEFEPLRKYGVSLNQADINAKALAMSGKSAASELTKNEKALAAQALIYEQSTDAAGAFARESDTLAGKQERLRATWANISAAIGGAVLPAVSALTGAIGGLLARVAESEGFNSALSAIGGFFSSLGSGTGPLGELASSFFQIVTSISPLAILIKAIAPLLPLLVDAFSELGSVLGGALSQVLPVIVEAASTLGEALGGVLAVILPVLIKLVTMFASIFAELLGPVLELVIPIITLVAEALAPILEAVAELIATLLPPLIDLFGGLIKAILPVVTAIIGLLVPILKVVIGVLAAIITGIVKAITWVLNFEKNIKGFATEVGINIAKVILWFQKVPEMIGNFFRDAGSWLYNVGRDIINGLLEGAGSLLKTVGSFFLNMLPDWIVGPFKVALGIASPSKVFREFGRDTIRGLNVGLTDNPQSIASSMRRVSGSVINGYRPVTYSGSSSSSRLASRPVLAVTVQALAPSPAIGRAVVEALEDYQRIGGRLP